MAVSPVASGAGRISGIRAVVFDAVGTLLHPRPEMAPVYQSALQRHCGLELSIDQIRDHVSNSIRRRSADGCHRTSEATERAFWRNIIGELAGNQIGGDACFAELFTHFGQPAHWSCFGDADDAVQWLSSQGITVAVASNFDSRLHRVMDGIPTLSTIRYRFISSELGWRKPADEFFQFVAQRLCLPVDQILVVGDDPTVDVAGALRAGCAAAWIRRADAAKTAANPGTICLDSLTQLLSYFDCGPATP